MLVFTHPFIFSRIKRGEVKPKRKNPATKCYFCNKKITGRNIYHTWERAYENALTRHCCHRTNCQLRLAQGTRYYGYKEVRTIY